VDEINEDDVLLPFEKHYLREPLRRYMRIKRNNRFAAIQALPEMWTCFTLLDATCEREFHDLYHVIDPSARLPLYLLIGSFVRTRIAFDLGFTGYIAASADLMRGTIEYAVHGKRIHEDPSLAEVWLDKDKGKDELNVYKNAFERNKKDRLFSGQEALHHYWSQFSEWGSHSTKAALALRLKFQEGDEPKSSFEAFEIDHSTLAKFLLMLIDAAHRLELLVFGLFGVRLNRDVELCRMRTQFECAKAKAEAKHRRRPCQNPLAKDR